MKKYFHLQVTAAAFGAAGQRCMALSTAVFVGDARMWIPDLIERARRLVVGPGWDATTEIGPVISRKAKRRIVDLVESAKAEGAEVPLDGTEIRVNGFEQGNFVGATIITGVEPGMLCYKVKLENNVN
jgi:malonate-semialdehyde dehydrogenase (acetylating) / methylmalonate-semialdehyde dehydrogenase